MTLVPVENCIPNVIFKPADVSKTSGLLGRVTNFVGELIVTKYSSGIIIIFTYGTYVILCRSK